MYQGTTPQLPLTVEGFDLTDKTVFVTLADGSGSYKITKTGEDLTVTYDSEADESLIICPYTQEETLAMKGERLGYIQVRFIDSDGHAMATEKAPVMIKEVLYTDIIGYEGV